MKAQLQQIKNFLDLAEQSAHHNDPVQAHYYFQQGAALAVRYATRLFTGIDFDLPHERPLSLAIDLLRSFRELINESIARHIPQEDQQNRLLQLLDDFPLLWADGIIHRSVRSLHAFEKDIAALELPEKGALMDRNASCSKSLPSIDIWIHRWEQLLFTDFTPDIAAINDDSAKDHDALRAVAMKIIGRAEELAFVLATLYACTLFSEVEADVFVKPPRLLASYWRTGFSFSWRTKQKIYLSALRDTLRLLEHSFREFQPSGAAPNNHNI